MLTHTYIHTCMYPSTHTYTYSTLTCAHARIHYTRAHTCAHTRTAHVCTCPHTCMHRHTRAQTHSPVHTHMHVHRGSGLSVRGEAHPALPAWGAQKRGAGSGCSLAAEPEHAEGEWRPGHLGTKECPWLALGLSHFVLFSGKQLEKSPILPFLEADLNKQTEPDNF